MPRLTHFEIYVDEPERAVKFYENVFGWIIKKWEGPFDYWIVTTGEDEPGINGGLVKRPKPVTGSDSVIAYVCSIDVKSVDEFTEKVTANGGEVVNPKQPIPGVGWFAQCKDTEGNLFDLMQEDQSAK